MSLRMCVIAAACAGVFAAAPSMAQTASASVQLDQFGYQLIDLDLNDNITPAISFTEEIYSSSGYDFGADGQEIDTFGQTAATGQFGYARTSSSATDSSAGAAIWGPSARYLEASGGNFYSWNVELTPATGVWFTSVVTLAAAARGNYMTAESRAMMDAVVPYVENNGNWLGPDSRFADAIIIVDDQLSYRLSGYLHTGTEPGQGLFRLTTTARVQGIAPVPEPSGWAMLLAALGLTGCRLYRQRQRSLRHNL